jgi:acyl carrier protein
MTTISSQTPEGLPHRCPVCGKYAAVDPSFPGGDSTCPRCGHLLWWFQDRFGRIPGLDPEQVFLDSSFLEDLDADSLDVAGLVEEIEQEFGVTIPAEEVERIETVEDAIRYINEHLGDAA